jgi:hypothetical protein
MQQTAYKSQIKRLADPAESKVSNMTINEGISALFAKMPMVGFIQAGNNGASEYYIGTVVDNAEIAEFMKPGLDAFINDIENPEKARAILNDYKAVLDAKGRRTYYNYSSAGVAEAVAEPSGQLATSNKVVEGDIFTLLGIPVITTNLGGVHGAGLAQAAKAKGLIKQGEGQFSASESVVTLPVKLKWSDDMSMNNNMELLTESLRSLIKVAKANPQNNYLLPLAGLGHGEGVVEEILPLLIKTVAASSNIQLVLPAEGVNLGRQGSVRKDATRQNMPQIKAMLSEAGLLTTQPSVEVSKVSDKQFENIAINQVGPDTRINYETGEIEEVAKLYDENKFIKNGRYDLTTTNIKTLFAEYPDDVFVFDDLYTKEEDRFRLLPKSNTREVWRSGLAAGNSFAISTKLSGGISPTDEKFEKMKEIIDKQIDQLKELKASGKTIRFSKIGVAQNWAGWNYILDGRLSKANNTPAPNAFVYLSKRLFDEFGYRNPRFDAVTTSADIDKGITGGLTGFEYYQEEYKNQGAQTMTDKEIVEFIKMCKGLQ